MPASSPGLFIVAPREDAAPGATCAEARQHPVRARANWLHRRLRRLVERLAFRSDLHVDEARDRLDFPIARWFGNRLLYREPRRGANALAGGLALLGSDCRETISGHLPDTS